METLVNIILRIYRHSAKFTANGAVSGTQIFNDDRGFGSAYAHNSTNVFAGLYLKNFIDSPNTTSEIYYNVCHKRSGSSSGIFDGYNMDNISIIRGRWIKNEYIKHGNNRIKNW